MTGRAPLPVMAAPDPSVAHVVLPARREVVDRLAAFVRVCSCGAAAWGWTREEADAAAAPHIEAQAARVNAGAETAAAARTTPGTGIPTQEPAETVSAARDTRPHWVVELVVLALELAAGTDAPRAARVLERVPVHVRAEADAWRRREGDPA